MLIRFSMPLWKQHPTSATANARTRILTLWHISRLLICLLQLSMLCRKVLAYDGYILILLIIENRKILL